MSTDYIKCKKPWKESLNLQNFNDVAKECVCETNVLVIFEGVKWNKAIYQLLYLRGIVKSTDSRGQWDDKSLWKCHMLKLTMADVGGILGYIPLVILHGVDYVVSPKGYKIRMELNYILPVACFCINQIY